MHWLTNSFSLKLYATIFLVCAVVFIENKLSSTYSKNLKFGNITIVLGAYVCIFVKPVFGLKIP